MRFNQKEFNNFIIDNDVVGFFDKEVTLASGRSSHWYVNWRKISNDVFLMDELSDYVINFVTSRGLKPNCFYGVPEGATKLGIITQFKWAKQSDFYDKGSHSLPMGRAKPKEHGDPKDRYFVGEPRGKIVCLEDVTTTGNSLIKSCQGLLELKSNRLIICAVGLTDRMEITGYKESPGIVIEKTSVKNAMSLLDIRYESMSSAEELLELAVKKYKPNTEIIKSIEKEFEEYGIKPIKLA
ncbi:Orotate phosphoribosyltransferase [uncultured archaeon]|nr:Orotate phosphoribosyltransferase [uncultured archaeon]